MRKRPALPVGVVALGCAALNLAGAAPASFHAAVASLSPMLFVRAAGADAYQVSDRLLVRYDRASGGIRLSKTAAPLEDQGAYLAGQLAPVWCRIAGNADAVAARMNRFLTSLLARSEVLRRQGRAGVNLTVRADAGQCRLQAHSEGLRSFLLLEPTQGPFVWPPQVTP
ncbi:hypothetical protein [Deinococcus sp.]|uniref:hypothetical protein n=1 Tax=Deinococcus sp. TaxID=47478 RepID=UPI003C7B5E10